MQNSDRPASSSSLPLLLDVLTELIDAAALPSDPAWLTPWQRWRLLADVLRGMTPVRGGERPRDIPFGRAHRDSMRLAQILDFPLVGSVQASHNGRPVGGPPLRGTQEAFGGRKPVQLSFLDWLVALELIVLTDAAQPDADVERDNLASTAIGAVISQLEDSPLGKRLDPEELDGILARLYRLLGLNDVERLQCEGRGNRADVRSLIRFAMTLAGIGNLNFLGHSLEARSRLLEGVVPSQKQVESLEQRRVTVVTIRTRHVQNFIYRSQRHYHMRGASVWCSLSLSLLRDALMSVDSPFGDRVMVLSDSDNGFQLAFGLENDRGETADDLNARVRAAVRDVLTVFNDGTRTPFHNHFPGLTQWIREAQANGIQLTDALPSYQVEAENVSLLDLATDETVFKPDYEKSEEGVIKLPSTPVSDEDECSDRENDRAVFSQTPPWHNESQSEGEYGWPTLLFSRVGSSYRMRTQLALGEEVREHDELKASLLSPWFYRRDLKRHFGDEAGNFRISFAIVDGDRIRRRFVERSTLTRPAESAHLASRFYHLWISALRQSLSTGNASETADRTRILPIDIVYFGGDDIVFLGPEEIVSPIVSAILNSGPDDEISSDGPAEDGVVADERPLTFSGATIEFNDSDDDDRRMTEAAVKNLYNSLKCVKRKKKNGQLEMDESSLRQEFLKYGYEASLTRTGRWLRVQITRFADS